MQGNEGVLTNAEDADEAALLAALADYESHAMQRHNDDVAKATEVSI